MTPHTLATLQREAKSAARRLARSLNLCRDAEADICQDLLADLLSRLHRFDPDRGTLGAFAGRIVANQASCVAKQIQRERRVMPCSLDQDALRLKSAAMEAGAVHGLAMNSHGQIRKQAARSTVFCPIWWRVNRSTPSMGRLFTSCETARGGSMVAPASIALATSSSGKLAALAVHSAGK